MGDTRVLWVIYTPFAACGFIFNAEWDLFADMSTSLFLGVTCFSDFSLSLLKQSNPCHPVATKVERCEMEDPQNFHYEIRTLGNNLWSRLPNYDSWIWQKWRFGDLSCLHRYELQICQGIVLAPSSPAQELSEPDMPRARCLWRAGSLKKQQK